MDQWSNSKTWFGKSLQTIRIESIPFLFHTVSWLNCLIFGLLRPARDPFYDQNITREFFRFWQEAGGKGEYVYIVEHALANGRLLSLPGEFIPLKKLILILISNFFFDREVFSIE